MTDTMSWIAHRAADAGGSALAAVLGPVAKLRDAKPVHPRGAVHVATLEVTDPAPSLGVPFFTESGVHDCLVRVSRTVGAPPPWPDIGGLALRLRPQAAEGSRCDLLFASTGAGSLTRWLPAVRRDPVAGPLTTLIPMRSVSGPVQFLLTGVGARPTAYQLSWASPRADWKSLGRLVLGGEVEPVSDPPVRFDPIVNPVDGLSNYQSVRRLREPAYKWARKLWPERLPGRAVRWR